MKGLKTFQLSRPEAAHKKENQPTLKFPETMMINSSSPVSASSSSTRKVAFDEIEFLEFLTILGDNPAVSAGAPVALGNELVRRSMMDVDFYEQNRGKRRHRKKLALPVDARARL